MIIGIISCKKESVDTYDCAGTAPKYTTDIKSILDANCATSGCHNATTKASGHDYSSYSQAVAHSGHSEFLGSIQHKSGFDPMPLGGNKLSDAQIKLISCWVQNGTPE